MNSRVDRLQLLVQQPKVVAEDDRIIAVVRRLNFCELESVPAPSRSAVIEPTRLKKRGEAGEGESSWFSRYDLESEIRVVCKPE